MNASDRCDSASPTLRSSDTRHLSTDSAYGDEVDSDETEKRLEMLSVAWTSEEKPSIEPFVNLIFCSFFFLPQIP